MPAVHWYFVDVWQCRQGLIVLWFIINALGEWGSGDLSSRTINALSTSKLCLKVCQLASTPMQHNNSTRQQARTRQGWAERLIAKQSFWAGNHHDNPSWVCEWAAIGCGKHEGVGKGGISWSGRSVSFFGSLHELVKERKHKDKFDFTLFKGRNVSTSLHIKIRVPQDLLHRTLCCIVREVAIQGCMKASFAVNLFRGSLRSKHLMKSFAWSLFVDQAWTGNWHWPLSMDSKMSRSVSPLNGG